MSKKSKKEKSSSKKSAKKRKISKHILQANKDHADLEKARASEGLPLDEEQVEAATAGALTKTSKKKQKSDATDGTTSPSTPPSNTTSHTKDVKEAAGYVTNWKNYRDQWKFNKNTQSWLIRHMYETDKVTKGTFTVLLEYLQGLQGKGAKDRILQDATRRALRYKRFIGEEEDEDGNNERQTMVEFADDTKDDDNSGKKKKKKSKADLATATEDEKRWNELNDHDKRKEYKRARKILETLKKSD